MRKAAFLLLIAVCLLFPIKTFSQDHRQDSVIAPVKKEKQISIKQKHSPTKATIYSAVLPGLGQAYNRKYWKIPIIYTGFGVLGYFIDYNHKKFVLYRDEYIYRRDHNGTGESDELVIFTDDDLLLLKNYYRRNLEYSVIFTGLLYVLNIVDASVDAHLMSFDMSDDLSMDLQPCILSYSSKEKIMGLNLSLKF